LKQILQSLKDGSTTVADVPLPRNSKGSLLIETSISLVSVGTEKMLLDFGKAGWIKKARQQPDKVRMVLDKIKTDGIKPTLEAVFNKLDQPLPLGYCNVGEVLQVGSSVDSFKIGDRVISNGYHAEAVSVPQNLCAKIPENVSNEEASFTVMGAIALQGIRLVKPTLGESVVVIGLGLIGLLTVQLLRANGCRVLGIDFDRDKLDLAKKFGADIVDLSSGQDPVMISEAFSRGRGVDAVIVTASTESSEPIHQAANMCRKNGRIVLVGVTGLELSREDFFKKEITFQVSASYGPGRYDPNYEEKGHDYPVGYVRWTEQRNFEAILDMLHSGALDVKSLITHKFDILDAEKAYQLFDGNEPSLGILLSYPNQVDLQKKSLVISLEENKKNDKSISSPKISFLGAGNYATSTLISAFKHSGATLNNIASSAGISGAHAAKKFAFNKTTTDSDELFSDKETDAVVITTRHNSHSNFVIQGIKSGKNLFVEKPLCLTLEELENIESGYNSKCILMVGFNRRFAPHIQKIKELLESKKSPKSIIMTINAGSIPSDHWTQDLEVGGGRIIGEACHFIDLARFLIGYPIKNYHRFTMSDITDDTSTIQLFFEDGSICTINYFSNGAKSFPKERIEIFASGGILQLDNYRKLKGFRWPGFKSMNLWKQDKGQQLCAAAFVEAVSNKNPSPIPFNEIIEVSRVSIELANQ